MLACVCMFLPSFRWITGYLKTEAVSYNCLPLKSMEHWSYPFSTWIFLSFICLLLWSLQGQLLTWTFISEAFSNNFLLSTFTNYTNWNWAYANLSLATFLLSQPETLSSLEREIMPGYELSMSLRIFIRTWSLWRTQKHHPWSRMKAEKYSRMRMISNTTI